MRVRRHRCGTEESHSMCDYSLMHVKSRPASVGDKLRTTNFGTGTRGFAAPSDPGTAVCVLPGTELAFNSEIAVYGACGPTQYKTAIFRQINRDFRIEGDRKSTRLNSSHVAISYAVF